MATQLLAEAPASGLGKLLMDERFQVPNHQRNYDWEDDKIKQLLEDIESAIERNDSFYFVGLMVFMRRLDDGRLVVLDGQQRLATAVILLSAIRNWFSTVDTVTAQQIQTNFIGASELGEKDILPKLALNYYNDEAFQQYIVNGVHVQEIKKALATLKRNDPNYQILSASLLCHQRVTEIAATSTVDEAKKYLLRIATFIRDAVMIVRLTVPNEASAFRVFETLNDRGQELSAMDLVKNHLFGLAAQRSKDKLRALEFRWAQLMQTLANAKADEFLKVYWTSRNGRVQVGDLFQEVKKRCTTSDEAVSLSVDMLEAAEHYAALETADDPVWAPYDPAVRQSVRSLKVVGSKQIRPVVLAALKRFEPKEMARLLRLLEVVIVRYQLIGEQRTGAIEIACARLAKSIFTKDVLTGQGARVALADIYPSDGDFHAAFTAKQEPNNQKVQYLLRNLEAQRRTVEHGKMSGEETLGDALTVEHVLPRNPGEAWQPVVSADSAIVDDCAFRLGNLCLLTKVNTELGGAAFEEKRKTFENSDILLTREIADNASWTRKEIFHRQAGMAKLAVSAWRFDGN